MKKVTALSTGLCLLFVGSGIAFAQDAMAPPKVLVIQREFLKPGKGGSLHAKTESAFVNAMAAAKWPVHYFGMDSLSGPSRSLFFTGYPSFEAWEKDSLAVQKNATLSAGIDRAIIADGDLLSAYEQSVTVLREDLSLRSSVEIAHMRYFEISQLPFVRDIKDWGARKDVYGRIWKDSGHTGQSSNGFTERLAQDGTASSRHQPDEVSRRSRQRVRRFKVHGRQSADDEKLAERRRPARVEPDQSLRLQSKESYQPTADQSRRVLGAQQPRLRQPNRRNSSPARNSAKPEVPGSNS